MSRGARKGEAVASAAMSRGDGYPRAPAGERPRGSGLGSATCGAGVRAPVAERPLRAGDGERALSERPRRGVGGTAIGGGRPVVTVRVALGCARAWRRSSGVVGVLLGLGPSPGPSSLRLDCTDARRCG